MNIRWEALFTLRGRIGRRTFWTLAGPFFALIGIMAGMSLAQAPDAGEVWDTFYFYGFAFSLVVALFGVRRLHDRGLPGRWMLMVVLPFVLAWLPPLLPLLYVWPMVMLVLLVIVGAAPGDPGVNRFGRPGSGSPFPDETRRGAEQTRHLPDRG